MKQVYRVHELRRDPFVHGAYNKCMSAFRSTIAFQTFIYSKIICGILFNFTFYCSTKKSPNSVHCTLCTDIKQYEVQTHIEIATTDIRIYLSIFITFSSNSITSSAILNIFLLLRTVGYWLFYFLLRLLHYHSIDPHFLFT